MRINKTILGVLRRWYAYLPWVFMLVAWPLSFSIWQQERASEFNDKRQLFDHQVNETRTAIEQYLSSINQSLLAVRHFYDASDQVEPQEFEQFVEGILRSQFSTGVEEVGFIRFDKPNKQALIEYHVKRDKQAAESPVHDAFMVATLKRALEQAATLNQALITTYVASETTEENTCSCMAMVLPVFIKSVKYPFKEAQLYGWVYINFDLPRYLDLLIGADRSQILYALYELPGIGDVSPPMLYVSHALHAGKEAEQPLFLESQRIEAYAKTWRLDAESLPAFEQQLQYQQATILSGLTLFVILSMAGIMLLMISRVRAVDELNRTNKALELSNDRWHFALEGAGDGVWDWDIPRGKVEFSKQWKKMLGYQEDEILDDFHEWQSRVHPEDYVPVQQALESVLKGSNGQYSVEYRMRCKNDEWKWVLARGMVVRRDANQKPLRMVGTITDISKLKQSEEAIWQHANFDALTGLPNRRMLYARLEQEIQKCEQNGKRLALIFMDIDRFKEVNDSYGHDQGDILLMQAAVRLRDCVFARDIVSRFGGDEFVILVPDLDWASIKNTEIIADKILNTMVEPFNLTQLKVFVSASVGIAIYPDDAQDLDGLVKSVDQAMYESKNRGGNCFTFFTQEMQTHALNRMQMSNDLRDAIEKEQFFIEYQPIIQLKTGEIHKAEALLRWQHPQRGLVSPGEFIPVAEDSRLINEIGNWVFKTVFQQALDWKHTFHHPIQISVNKSPIQFLQTDHINPHWAEFLLSDPEYAGLVAIEITESLLLEPSSQVLNWLEYYKQHHVEISLDDFGTGYSSLAYLRKFNIDYLKIDQSFVASLETNQEDKILCESIISMAHSLGMRVIAEGIETAGQLQMLLQMGCDFGQGYFFSKPISVEAFKTFVQERQAT